MRIFIGGDRDWDDKDAVWELITDIRKGEKASTSILWMSGGARGVDSMVREVCSEIGLPFCEFPAAWDGLGRRAGPIRNSWAIKFGLPDRFYGVHNHILTSRGTRDMLKKCLKKDVECYLVTTIYGHPTIVRVSEIPH